MPTDRSSFEAAFYARPGTHPDTPTLCSSPLVVLRRRAAAEGLDVVEGTAAWAEPGGLLQREAYEGLRDEILGQLRQAWEVAQREGGARTSLNLLFRHAIGVGKRARTETAIARGTTSVSHAAVEMAEELQGSIEGRCVTVVGAGSMGEGIAVALHGDGVGDVRVGARFRWGRARRNRCDSLPIACGGHHRRQRPGDPRPIARRRLQGL